MLRYRDGLCTQLAILSDKQRYRLIDTMEEDITQNKKTYDRKYFEYLKSYVAETRDNAESFDEYKEACYYLEKLNWLEPKNLDCTYYEAEEEIIQELRRYLPEEMKRELNRLIDMIDNRWIELEHMKRANAEY